MRFLTFATQFFLAVKKMLGVQLYKSVTVAGLRRSSSNFLRISRHGHGNRILAVAMKAGNELRKGEDYRQARSIVLLRVIYRS